MSLVSTRKPKVGNLVKHEYEPAHGFCREVATVNVAADTEVSVGSVLGKVTASGKYVPRDPDASDGSEVAAGVAVENKTITAATDTTLAVMVRGNSILAKGALVFDVTHDAGEQATAISEIEALGILVRTSV